MTGRSDPWDSGPSEEPGPTQYQHLRQISASEVLDEPYQQPSDSLSNDYGYKSSYYARQQGDAYKSYPAAQAPYSYDNYHETSHQNRAGHTEGLM
jgi:hypothetical protein